MMFFRNFKEHYERFTEIELVVADKDMSQMTSLTKAFPNALIHLCLFHIEQAFLRKIQSMKIEKDDAELAKKMFRQMAFSTTNEEYQEIASRFVATFPGEVASYFEDNWGCMPDNWAGYSFKNLICYGETTNNKLESKNSALKNLINSTDNLDACLTKLIKFIKDDHANSKYNLRYIKMTSSKSSENDSELMLLLKLNSTPKAVSIVKKSEKLAKRRGIHFNRIGNGQYDVFLPD